MYANCYIYWRPVDVINGLRRPAVRKPRGDHHDEKRSQETFDLEDDFGMSHQHDENQIRDPRRRRMLQKA
jgi:hypothetical protein